MGLPVLTCSSAARGARPRTRAAPVCSFGAWPSPAYSQAATCGSARRRAGPRPPASGAPRGSGRRTTPRASSASRHISSPNSRKSATRPAFSSDWFSSAPWPGTRTSFQNSSRSAGIFSSACSQAAARCGPCRSCPTSACPSSRWNESTVRAALDRRGAACVRAVAASSRLLELAAVGRDLLELRARRGSRRSCTGCTK